LHEGSFYVDDESNMRILLNPSVFYLTIVFALAYVKTDVEDLQPPTLDGRRQAFTATAAGFAAKDSAQAEAMPPYDSNGRKNSVRLA
jgi:hypothetical protein